MHDVIYNYSIVGFESSIALPFRLVGCTHSELSETLSKLGHTHIR